MLYILARNKDQAAIAAHFIGIEKSEYQLVGSAADFSGLRGVNVLTFGAYFMRPDWGRIKDELAIIEAHVWSLSDRP